MSTSLCHILVKTVFTKLYTTLGTYFGNVRNQNFPNQFPIRIIPCSLENTIEIYKIIKHF